MTATKEHLGTGRRKRAIARVILRPGTGEFKVNGRDSKEYFCERQLWMERINEPLLRANVAEKFNILVNVHGGGIKGQADAIRLGISRALVELDESNRPLLKSLGMLTRDAREVDRKHYYRRKARKMPQYFKR
jgi:small subunit ribosomal protein S9